ncbi:hypothetical protein D9619_006818 [Psilocybe cf. subviscida]|uniref:pyranose dehydrogenase (acceptor) n=1 Tax=Psilocybe cf. subviscida TaxID=2480587 RepID=A0A8H5B3V3_9AGAR|nr:hypothetical protein D9619_006818 [Psilocybe cf. subviscida]
MPRTPTMHWSHPLLLLAFLSAPSKAIIVSRPLQQYDFIVVGGGTGGNVVANRLTENPNVSVLVIEAGGLPDGNLNISIPFFCTRAAPHTSVDWNYTTISQPSLGNRSLAYPRGFVLGGSSSINYMVYTRGSREDYDRYARISGDEGWSWNKMLPYFRKNERFGPPSDHHSTVGQIDPAVHSFDGVNSVTVYGFPQATDKRIIDTTKQLPEFPFNLDYNSGSPLGIGRSSSATSYLGPQFMKRPNLHVLLNTEVSRVLSSGQRKNGVPLLDTVQYTSFGTLRTVKSKREIILSAGAVNTPRILLHSGIGDSKDLSALGIKTILHNPSVGRNLSDHPIVSNQWTVNSTDTLESFTSNATAAAEDLALWQTTRTGPLSDGTANNIGWLRLASNASIFEHQSDPAAGPKTPHFELLFSNGLTRPPFPTSGNFLSISTVMLTPTSRGSITINSTNPFSAPIIDLGFLSTPFDIFAMREGIKAARRFVLAPAWDNYIISRLSNATTDSEIETFARASASTLFHPVGTAAMSPRHAAYGVVDPDLTVKGLAGLRIVDASVLPLVPAAHTQVAVYVFAERASDLIKAQWHL